MPLFIIEGKFMADEKERSVLVNDETLSKMTDAMLEFQLSQLKTAVNEYPVDVSRFNAVFDEAIQERDRVSAILIMAFIDDVLGEFYASYLNSKIPGGLASLLEGYGPLASAGGRLQMAFALRWLGEDNFRNATLLRKIRNHFAHSTVAGTFDDAPVRNFIASMSSPEARIFRKDLFPCAREFTNRERYLIRALLTASELWMDLAVRPRAAEFWLPQATARAWGRDSMPENLNALMKSAIRKVLEVAPLAPEVYTMHNKSV